MILRADKKHISRFEVPRSTPPASFLPVLNFRFAYEPGTVTEACPEYALSMFSELTEVTT